MNKQKYQPLTQSRLFRFMVYSLLFLLIVLVGTQVSFLFRPIGVLISTLFLPVFIAGILYYLFVPLVNLLDRGRFPRTGAILVVYVILGGIILFLILLSAPVLGSQIQSLVDNTPVLMRAAQNYLNALGENTLIQQWVPEFSQWYEDIPARASELVKVISQGISANFSGMVNFFANLVIVLTTVPFVLFFMLKDGSKLPRLTASYFPKDYQDEALDIMNGMGTTLGAYIKGQMIVSSFVGIMVLIGYGIIGVNYALLLAVVALVTNLIPYVGPIIGTVPGMVVALMDSPSKMVQVLIMIVIIQQVESQLVSPLVMGKKLKIHPLVIIFLLLTAGSLAGFLGLLLAVPTFAVVRTAGTYLYKLYILRKSALGAPESENQEEATMTRDESPDEIQTSQQDQPLKQQ